MSAKQEVEASCQADLDVLLMRLHYVCAGYMMDVAEASLAKRKSKKSELETSYNYYKDLMTSLQAHGYVMEDSIVGPEFNAIAARMEAAAEGLKLGPQS